MTRKPSSGHENAQRAAERAAELRQENEAKERRRRAVAVSVVVVGVIAAMLAIGFAVRSTSRDRQVATPPAGVVNTWAVPYGNASAPVKVAVYEDFMCPFCGQFEAASRPVLQKYVDQGRVQVQYHVISFLDRASNNTRYSTRAMNALAVVLDTAGPQAAKTFHDLLYEHQPAESTAGLSDEQLVDLAVRAGADKGEVSGPISSLKFEPWVENATKASADAGVTGTPTVKVDGKVLQAPTIDQMVASLQQAIQQRVND